MQIGLSGLAEKLIGWPRYTHKVQELDRMGFGINDVNVCLRIFIISEYHSLLAQLF